VSAALRHAAAAAIAVFVLPGLARADGFTASAEPAVSASQTTSSGEALDVGEVESLQLQQRYRLSLQRELFPLIRLNGNASYDQQNAIQRQDSAPLQRGESHLWGLGLRLDLGAGIWSGGLAYDLRGRGDDSKTGGAPRLSGPEQYAQTLTALAAWRPADLPSLDLRHVRTRSWDDLPEGVEQSSELTTLQASYQPTASVDARYRATYSVLGNERTGVEDRGFNHGVRASWSESYLERRLSLFATVDLAQSRRWSEATKSDGFRETLQTLAAGLSAVERFPATPERITLDPNAALADGVTTAGAGLDVGYARSDAGDTDPRDLGARFVDAATPVNELRVWVDQRLPTAISGAFSFAVYRSDDNLDWTPVSLRGAVSFSSLENRFEIPIVRTTARYLKVVTRPLASAVTTDRTFAQILVTELQAYLIEALAVGTKVETAHRIGGSVSSRLVLQRSWNVTWDAFADAARSSDRDFTPWLLTNGLSFTRRVATPLAVSGRAERSDVEAGLGLETSHRLSLSAAYEPLPTLGGTLSAGASRLDKQSTSQSDVSSQLGLRADLYRGVSLSSQGDFSYGWADGDSRTRRLGATGNAAVTPHRTVTVAGSFSYTDSLRTQPGVADIRDRAARIDGTVSWSPASAVAVAGSIGRELYRRSGTIAALTVNASPFRDGAVLLTLSYAETLDTITDTRSRNWGPNLRWRIARRGYLDLSYTDAHTRTAAATTDSKVLFARLSLSLG